MAGGVGATTRWNSSSAFAPVSVFRADVLRTVTDQSGTLFASSCRFICYAEARCCLLHSSICAPYALCQITLVSNALHLALLTIVFIAVVQWVQPELRRRGLQTLPIVRLQQNRSSTLIEIRCPTLLFALFPGVTRRSVAQSVLGP
jgi:hypothetical protein